MPFGDPSETPTPVATASLADTPPTAAMASVVAEVPPTAPTPEPAPVVEPTAAQPVEAVVVDETPAPVAAPAAESLEPIDFADLLQTRSLEFGGLESTVRLEEEDLFQTPHQEAAFTEMVKRLGVPDYDFGTAQSFQYVVTATGARFLNGPQIQSYGNPETAKTCCIVWDYLKTVEGKDEPVVAQHVLPLPADANVNSKQWRVRPPQGDNPYCEVLYNLAEFKFPLPLRTDKEMWPKASDLANALLEVETFADLCKLLLDGAPILRFDEGSPQEVQVTKVKKLQRGDASEYLTCSAHDEKGNPFTLFINDTELLEPGLVPAMVRKVEGKSEILISPENGSEPFKCALGGNYQKLLELPIGEVFYVSSIEIKDGAERISVILNVEGVKGPVGQFWANKKFSELVLKMREDGDFDEATTAFIKVQGHKKTSEGTKFPDLQYWLTTNFTNPVLLKHMKRQKVQFPTSLLQKAVLSLTPAEQEKFKGDMKALTAA